MASAPANLGPVLPSRPAVFHQARELQHLAARAVEFAGTGPTADLALALRQLEQMRAILGPGRADDGGGSLIHRSHGRGPAAALAGSGGRAARQAVGLGGERQAARAVPVPRIEVGQLCAVRCRQGRGRCVCFGCQWQGDLFRFLMDINGWDFATALAEAEALAGIAPGGEAAPSRGPVQRERNPAPRRDRAMMAPIDFARAIWRRARPDAGAAERYFRGRGVPALALTPGRLATFRYLAECPVVLPREGETLRGLPNAPALMALVRQPLLRGEGSPHELDFVPCGLHVTYLNPAGDGTMVRRKPWARADDPDPLLPKRRMLGPVGGGAVILGAYEATAALYVGEGNETVLSAIGLAGAPPEAVGVATLSLDNLQGVPKLWANRTWPLHAIEPDPERPCFSIAGHRGPITGLVDSDMSPLRGKRDRKTREFEGETVIERKGGPLVHRPITGAERATICGTLFVKGWRDAGAADVRAVRAPAGMDFNDAAREAEHV